MENQLGDLVLGTQARHFRARKVGRIVRDDGMRKPEEAHDILHVEFDNLLLCNAGERYCFHPLSKVVHDD